jgi:hypothetical protein
MIDTKLGIRRLVIKLTHWEYWPFHVVYGPIYFYWFWLCIKARSFFFFSASNPSIKNGGFLMESKHQIYQLIPPAFYPVTIHCEAGIKMESVLEMLRKEQIVFPMIAKPDTGMRGLRVKLLHGEAELLEYISQSPVDFLLQQFVSYKEEAGIFYIRKPGSDTGHISGVVGKVFLTLVGDGVTTMTKLITQHDRHLLQLPALKKVYGSKLDKVLAEGEVFEAVPYGNHSRGAKFVNLTHLVNADLEKVINGVCKQIPDFYFGRMDIKYDNWKDLCNGKKFSIIELNGAGSEPTHMYDPSHNIFFAWKEIIRHWNALYTISALNHKKNGHSYMPLKEGLEMLRQNSRQVKLIS